MIPPVLVDLKSVKNLQGLFSAKFASKYPVKQRSAITATNCFASAVLKIGYSLTKIAHAATKTLGLEEPQEWSERSFCPSE